jgi:hypothetical protein
VVIDKLDAVGRTDAAAHAARLGVIDSVRTSAMSARCAPCRRYKAQRAFRRF